jgi:potassium-dependent mechanosensitive channel
MLLLMSVSAAAGPSLGLNGLKKSSYDDINLVQANFDPVALTSEVEKKLATVKQKLAAIPADEISVQNITDPVGKNTNIPRRVLLKQLTYLYEGQLERLAYLQFSQKKRTQYEMEASNWAGFKSTSPPSFLLADNLQATVTRLNKNIDEIESLDTVDSQVEAYLMSLIQSTSIKFRQAEEALEHAKESSKQQAGLRLKRDHLELENQLNLARALSYQIEKKIMHESVLESRAKLILANKQREEIGDKVELTKQEVDQIYANIEIEKQHIHAEIQQAIKELEASKQQKSVTQESKSTALQQSHISQLKNIDVKLQVLNRMLSYLDLQQEIWGQRWAYAKVTDRKKASEAYALISKHQGVLQAIYNYIVLHRRQTLALLTDQTTERITELQDLTKPPETPDFDLVISYSRLLGGIESTENLLARFKSDLDAKFKVKSLYDSFEEYLLSTREFLSVIWSYELFAIQDSIEIDGQRLVSQNSVTVSKVITALAILIIGYWMASKLSRYVESLAVTRFKMDASLARIARRWIFFLEVLLLVIISMLVVRIPLTVFAFMGGAVAIGAGFGMQNLLKNLISGLMLLIERPFRPGDLVEVGGVRGRITDIGVRSSNILDANGIETIIPNSTFIEQNVTNWTLSDQVIRTVIKVGVAHGSSTKETSRILLEEANRHGLVLENPAPQVLFEDFGDDSLLFGLYVWVQLKVDVSWKAIASDLRFMINRSLSEHGIVIAFPQRDIHLDTSRPLEVHVVSDAVTASTPVNKQPISDDSTKQQAPHLPG